MTPEEARAIILRVLGRIAPEIDADTIDPEAELDAELDLDSMDFLNLVDGVCATTSLEIPEHDYPRIMTLASFTAYVSRESTSPAR